jgi:tripartite-type tricarboxylate transporter receptor subunit TctC
MVPLGAGSASDIMARVVAAQLTRQTQDHGRRREPARCRRNHRFRLVARSVPDGYTILAYGALATANALYSKVPYDTLADFVPVIPFGIQPLVIVASPAKYKTLAELIAAGKANARCAELFIGGRRLRLAFCRRAVARQRRH